MRGVHYFLHSIVLIAVLGVFFPPILALIINNPHGSLHLLIAAAAVIWDRRLPGLTFTQKMGRTFLSLILVSLFAISRCQADAGTKSISFTQEWFGHARGQSLTVHYVSGQHILHSWVSSYVMWENIVWKVKSSWRETHGSKFIVNTRVQLLLFTEPSAQKCTAPAKNHNYLLFVKKKTNICNRFVKIPFSQLTLWLCLSLVTCTTLGWSNVVATIWGAFVSTLSVS